MTQRENYCYLVGLNPYDSERYSEAKIKAHIAAAEKRWRKEAADANSLFKNRFRATERLRAVPDMYSVMGSSVLRQEEFANGVRELKAKASKLNKEVITFQDGSKYIMEGAARRLCDRLGWGDVRESDVLKASGIKSAEEPQPAGPDAVNAYNKMADVGEYTPRGLLNTLIENPSLEIGINSLDDSAGAKECRDALGAVYQRLSTMRQGRFENQDAYIQAVRAVKVAIRTDEGYAETDMYGRCMHALDPAFEMMEADYGQPFTPGYLRDLINIYVNGGGEKLDNAMAVRILERECCRRHYVANFSSSDIRLALCPNCKAMISESDDTVFCPVCGMALRIVCPRCGTPQPSTNLNCMKCGFEFAEGLKESRDERAKVIQLLRDGNIVEAEAEYAQMRQKYPDYAGDGDLQSQIERSAFEYRKVLDRVSADYSIRHLADLRDAVDDAKAKYPKIMEAEKVRQMYEEACEKYAEADDICARAEASSGEEAMNLYIEASVRCPDHPKAVRRLRDYPPDGPADAVCRVRRDGILVKYAIPRDRKSVSFCIYRAENSLPAVDQTTVPLAEIPGGVYLDSDADPGIDYYYKIYAKRWGILSRDFAQCGPAMIHGEVESVSIERLEDGLRLSYTAPKGCSAVHIWRKEGDVNAAETELRHENIGVVEDRSLKGETEYYYLFQAEYDVNGRRVMSSGTMYHERTGAYPQPVNDMEVSWNRSDGSYSARWGSDADVVLYAATQHRSMLGRAVPLSGIEGWMTRIEPDEAYERGCKFSIPDGAAVYVYPMIIVGKTAVRGRETMIANLRPFRDVDKRMDGSDCDLVITWPADAEAAVISVRDPDDEGTPGETITVSKELYDRDGRVRIHMGMSNRKSVTLTAVYEINGERHESVPFTTEVYAGTSRKVRYRVTTERVREDRSKVRILMRFECPEGGSVPRVVMVVTDRGIPLRMSDGEPLWDSGEAIELENGRAETWFTADREKAVPERMRLFFADRNAYGLCKLVHPLYGRDH